MRRRQFILRALAIFYYTTRRTVRFLFGWLGLLVALRPRAQRQAWFGACVAALFRDLGATFIKVAQIMSTRPDLLPPHLIAALETLQDNVGPFPFGDVQNTLQSELGRPLAEIFAELGPIAIASASVAQVHKARLHDGRIVAVKVRRPRIEELCAFDLTFVRGFARLLERIPSFKLLAPVESVDEFGRGIRMQLDFVREAENNRRFRHNFAAERDVLFPTLVDELCTKQVLVMDFISGTKILHTHSAPEEAKRLADIGFRTMLKMVFIDGFVHADLHPGNLLVTPTHQIAILDLGLVGELDERHRRGFARYFAAWAQGDGTVMAQLMRDLSPSRLIPDYPAFEQAVVDFVRRYHGKKLGELQASLVLLDMMNILRKHRVRVNPNFTLVNIAIAVTEGIGKQLDPEVDLMAAALPFFAAHDFFAGAAAPPAS